MVGGGGRWCIPGMVGGGWCIPLPYYPGGYGVYTVLSQVLLFPLPGTPTVPLLHAEHRHRYTGGKRKRPWAQNGRNPWVRGEGEA